jgi:hypothetical protein
LISVQNDTEIIWRKLKNLKYAPYQSPSEEPPKKFLGLFGRSNVLGKYQKKLENLEENVRMEQSEATRRQVRMCICLFGLRQVKYDCEFFLSY